MKTVLRRYLGEVMTEAFSEKDIDGQITCQLHIDDRLACEAELLGRNCLMNINSYPPKRGYGTKMMEYLEKKAVENGFATMEVTDIKDEQYLKDFLTKRGYKLRPHHRIPDEFEATKELK